MSRPSLFQGPLHNHKTGLWPQRVASLIHRYDTPKWHAREKPTDQGSSFPWCWESRPARTTLQTLQDNSPDNADEALAQLLTAKAHIESCMFIQASAFRGPEAVRKPKQTPLRWHSASPGHILIVSTPYMDCAMNKAMLLVGWLEGMRNVGGVNLCSVIYRNDCFLVVNLDSSG
jgi:hypothetical protein